MAADVVKIGTIVVLSVPTLLAVPLYGLLIERERTAGTLAGCCTLETETMSSGSQISRSGRDGVALRCAMQATVLSTVVNRGAVRRIRCDVERYVATRGYASGYQPS